MTSKIQDEKTLPFEINYLPQFSVEKCEKELNENPERKIKAVQELRSLLQKNKSTRGIDFHEDLLVSYLRRNKYRTSDAQRQIQNSMADRGTENHAFKGVPDECFDLPSSKCLAVLPMRCQEGCGLILCRWSEWDPTELPFEQLRQVMAVLLSQALRDPMTQIHGFKLIHDFKGMSFTILRHLSPYTLHRFYNTSVNCFPARWKEIHVINQSLVGKIVWNALRPFLSAKIRNRTNFHSNTEELLGYFPSSVLPAEYGGNLRDSDTSDWIRRANKEQQKFTLQGQPNLY